MEFKKRIEESKINESFFTKFILVTDNLGITIYYNILCLITKSILLCLSKEEIGRRKDTPAKILSSIYSVHIMFA